MGVPFQVTFDAQDPRTVGEFWGVALGYRMDDPPPGFASWDEALQQIPEEHRNDAYAVIDPDGVGPRVFILKVPEGKTAKNRVHLDVNATAGVRDPEQKAAARRAHVERLVAAGGTVVEDRDGQFGEHWTVMLDPEGNEFCVQ